jgi:hypothetical protein
MAREFGAAMEQAIRDYVAQIEAAAELPAQLRMGRFVEPEPNF